MFRTATVSMIVVCVLLCLSSGVSALEYKFTTVFEESGISPDPVINDAGAIAFRAFSGAYPYSILRWTEGEGLVSIIQGGSYPSVPNHPSINESGLVGYQEPDGGLGIGPPAMSIVYSGSPGVMIDGKMEHFRQYGGRPAIDDSGWLNFYGRTSTDLSSRGVFRTDGNSVEIVYLEQPPIYLGGDTTPIVASGNGTVAWVGADEENYSVYFTSGGTPTEVADSSGDIESFLDNSLAPNMSVNDSGTVAFAAVLKDTDYETAIFVGNGGPLARVADCSGSFTAVRQPAINNDGTITFVAEFGGGVSQAILTGPDPTLDRVIGTGDGLLDLPGTIYAFELTGGSINDKGQIAFGVRYEPNWWTGLRYATILGTPIVHGDFNRDFTVDQNDLTLLLSNWGDSLQPEDWTSNWDGLVDQNELTAILSDWGYGTSAAAVPEPSSLILLSLALLSLIYTRLCK